MIQQAISTAQQDVLPVIVRSMTWLARETLAVELTPVPGIGLPAFSAGAHIDLVLPNGIRRSYSLSNAPAEAGRYVVGVKRADPSKGASSFIHDHLRVGQQIAVSAPRNNFPLVEDARRSILVAGGIGITPMAAMIERLSVLGAEWVLYYACRLPEDAAFLPRLEQLAAAGRGRIEMTYDQLPGAAMLDLPALVAREGGEGVHFYACGPGPMLDAFERATAGLPAGTAHLERFGGGVQEASTEALEEFDVTLAQSGVTLHITPETSILDALLDHGIDIPFSCMDGVCGSCRVGVLEGQPDHRDSVLSDEEQASNATMMVCCSGSRSARLLLDL